MPGTIPIRGEQMIGSRTLLTQDCMSRRYAPCDRTSSIGRPRLRVGGYTSYRNGSCWAGRKPGGLGRGGVRQPTRVAAKAKRQWSRRAPRVPPRVRCRGKHEKMSGGGRQSCRGPRGDARPGCASRVRSAAAGGCSHPASLRSRTLASLRRRTPRRRAARPRTREWKLSTSGCTYSAILPGGAGCRGAGSGATTHPRLLPGSCAAMIRWSSCSRGFPAWSRLTSTIGTGPTRFDPRTSRAGTRRSDDRSWSFSQLSSIAGHFSASRWFRQGPHGRPNRQQALFVSHRRAT